MKVRRYTAVAIPVLIFALAMLVFMDKGGGLRRESRAILLDDPSVVDGVEIAGKMDTVRLRKTGGKWQLSGGGKVNPVTIENLFFAAERLQIDGVSGGQAEWTDSQVREVSFHAENKLVLQYKTLSRDGHLLLRMKGSDRVFTVSLPGYPELDLTRIFSNSENHYRDHVFIDLPPSEIKMFELEKRGQHAFRFSMDEAGAVSCALPQSDSLVPAALLDEEAVRMLFTYFTSIRYEKKAADIESAPLVEPIQERWLASLYLESWQGEKHSLRVYSLPGDNGEKTHMFKALVWHNNSREALIVNYIYLDVLMRGLSAYIGDNP